MEQTEQSDGHHPHPTSFVVSHYFLNIDTEIGEIFIICFYNMLGIYAGWGLLWGVTLSCATFRPGLNVAFYMRRIKY